MTDLDKNGLAAAAAAMGLRPGSIGAHRLTAAIQAYLPYHVPGGGWQPIETAPRDGTVVLVGRFTALKEPADREGRIATDYWHTHPKHTFEGWGAFNTRHWPATHWMALPAAPHTLMEKL